MHKPESVQKNKTNKILCDFEIQADNLIRPEDQNYCLWTRRRELII